MEISLEVCGLKIGVDNSITESIKTGDWGLRLGFQSKEKTHRYEVVLNLEEAECLASRLITVTNQMRILKQEGISKCQIT